MPKRAVSWLLLLLSIAALALVITTGEGQASLSDLYVNEAAWQAIMAARTEREPDGGPLMQIADAVYFNGYKLPYDRLDQVLLYSLVEEDPSAYNPLVELVCYTEEARIAFCGEPLTDALVKASRPIPMMVYTDEEYALFQLKCTSLPILEIGMDASPFTVKEEDVSVRLRLFDNRREALNRQLDAAARIHMRGQNSKTYPKNDYRISLQTLSLGENWRNFPMPLLGLRADDDWILKGQYNDNRKIREVFSTELWYNTSADNHQFPIHNGYQYRYVEVFFGDYYWGLYALTHPVDAKQMELKPGEHLYKKESVISEFDMDLTIDPASPLDPTNLSDPRVLHAYEGGTTDTPDYAPLFDYYRTLLGTTEAERDKLYTIADLHNSIDTFLFLNLIQGVDHLKVTDGLFNMFLTAKLDAQGNTRMLYTPWDMDRTWGLGFGDKELMDPATNILMNTNIVVQLEQLGDPTIVDRTCQRYWELRSSQWSDEAIARMLHDYEDKVFASGAYERDFQRWYYFVLPPEYIPEYHTDYSNFIDYVHQRFVHMDAFIRQYEQNGLNKNP